MPEQVNHMGFECPALLDGVDLNVQKWDGTSTTTDHEITNTSHYDAANDRCDSDAIPGVTTFEGSLSFNYDSNNKPWPNLRDGKVVDVANLKCDKTGSMISGKILIKTLKVAPEGIDGLVTGEITFRNKGKMTYA